MVVLPQLLAQKKGAAIFRQAHTFEDQTFVCNGAEVSNGLKGILQVIEQAEAKHQVKPPQLRNLAGFHVRLLKGNSGKASARFLDVLRARVKPAGAQTAFRKRLGEESNAATRIHCIGKTQRGFQPLHDSPKRLVTGFNEGAVLLPVKRRQLDGYFRGGLSRLRLRRDRFEAWAGLHDGLLGAISRQHPFRSEDDVSL